MAESLYTVEKIIDKVYSEKLGRWVYLVKWEGFPDSDNSWEPEENLVPLGKLLENFNKSWESKNKPPVPKTSKISEAPSKKPIVTKVKGLVDQGELSFKKPSDSMQSKSPYLSLDSKDPLKNGSNGRTSSGNSKVQSSKGENSENSKESKIKDSLKESVKEGSKEPGKEIRKTPVKKAKKPQATMDDFKEEETVKLISKKSLEKSAARQEVEIDIGKNVFRNCKIVKPSLDQQVPWKIIGARKRNNVIQYVVVFKAPPICMPAVVPHDELAKRFPDLICDYVFSSFN
jgi:hypothetical protein